jgi:hypothetical protein
MPIKKCPAVLPKGLTDLIVAFGKSWANCPERPMPSVEICAEWERLLQAWVKDKDLPLFVRKTSQNRGHTILHKSGRKLIPADNSPAQWVFTRACENRCPTISELRTWLTKPSSNQEIPIAMILKKEEKKTLGYEMTLRKAKEVNVNIQGWKLGHIKSIGLNKQGALSDMDIEVLKEHHEYFLSPANMFVIPKQWAGLAEIQEVAAAMGRVPQEVNHLAT